MENVETKKRIGRPGFVVEREPLEAAVKAWNESHGPYKSRNGFLKAFAGSEFAMNAKLTNGKQKSMGAQSIGHYCDQLNVTIPVGKKQESV